MSRLTARNFSHPTMQAKIRGAHARSQNGASAPVVNAKGRVIMVAVWRQGPRPSFYVVEKNNFIGKDVSTMVYAAVDLTPPTPKKGFAARMIGRVVSFFRPKPVSVFAEYLGKAKAMIQEARDCKAQGYDLAAREAVRSALNFRRAAHAHARGL